MKIALIGPGIMSIPPPGWGAVEILIWDYHNELVKQGHSVEIINKIRSNENEQRDPSSQYCQDLISTINANDYDLVHLHYDVLYGILDSLTAKKIAITTHYPYIDQLYRHASDGYSQIFKFLLNQTRYYNITIAQKDYDTFVEHGVNRHLLFNVKNGINVNSFKFSEHPSVDRSIYLGKISRRKNQYKYQHLNGVDFIGDPEDFLFDYRSSNYKGKWTRDQVYNNLTEYSNLLLLSDGEADPLVVKEAFAAGLGVVLSKKSAENIDSSLKFITIIDDSDDIDMLITRNKCVAKSMRREIREYAEKNFDISISVKTLLAFLF